MASKHDEERELLQLQCELARLKLAATHRKKIERQLQDSHHNNNTAGHLLNAASSVSTSAWQLALLPKKIKYRAIMIVITILTQFFSNKKR